MGTDDRKNLGEMTEQELGVYLQEQTTAFNDTLGDLTEKMSAAQAQLTETLNILDEVQRAGAVFDEIREGCSCVSRFRSRIYDALAAARSVIGMSGHAMTAAIESIIEHDAAHNAIGQMFGAVGLEGVSENPDAIPDDLLKVIAKDPTTAAVTGHTYESLREALRNGDVKVIAIKERQMDDSEIN